MRACLKMVFLGVLMCTLTVAVMRWGIPDLPIATASAQTNQDIQPPTETLRSATAINAEAPSNPSSASQFIDMARLVLESSRDQSHTTALLIERATTVIIVFFTLLGTVGAFVGWSKLRDMEQKAKDAVKQFDEDLQTLRDAASTQSREFTSAIELATAAMRVEINNQAELLAARAEMDHAQNTELPEFSRNRLFTNAIKRIEKVLESQTLSIPARVRGLADCGYAVKRLGDVSKALKMVVDAANLAREHSPEMLHLLAYNAACYSALLKKNDDEIEGWLSEAIANKPEYRASVLEDPDFADHKEREWLKRLLS